MKQDHTVHKYFKTHFSTGTAIYRCGFEGCTHFVYEALIVGRRCICWRCRQPFTITWRTLKVKKFRCEECKRGKYNKIIEKVPVDYFSSTPNEDTIDDILSSIQLDLEEKGEEKNDNGS